LMGYQLLAFEHYAWLSKQYKHKIATLIICCLISSCLLY
jgi:hypothetical protein